nr:arylsulfatase [uncultured Roseateles sp.]
MSKHLHPTRVAAAILALTLGGLHAASAQQAQLAQALGTRPNILVIMADDVGPSNVGAYTHGMMAPTPNLDRIAREGLLFTDHYAEPTSTAGRSAFITGQMPIRTGLTTVGLPGSPIGHDKRDPSLAEVLKPLGYRSAHIGKHHMGDRDEHLPTSHGFDYFFGNLYHLNAEEEPEQIDYPKDPEFRKKYGPRGVLEARAGETPKDLGPLTAKRMQTIDDESTARSLKFLEESAKSKQPFFLWHNPTRMHVNTHLKPESRYLAAPYSSEEDVFGSGMMEMDGHIGQILDKLDQLGLAKNTIVVFTSDNGPQNFHYPDSGTTPFRGEKQSTWEGGYRVPMLVRWPAAIKPGTVSNAIQTHYDLFSTLAHAAGAPKVDEQLLQSHKVKIDGIDQLEHWQGKAPGPRKHFVYYNERELVGARIGPWKGLFKEREGFFDPLKPSFAFFNLRMDPYERSATGKDSNRLALRKAWIGGQMQDLLTEHAMSLRAFPPRQVGGSLNPSERAGTANKQ